MLVPNWPLSLSSINQIGNECVRVFAQGEDAGFINELNHVCVWALLKTQQRSWRTTHQQDAICVSVLTTNLEQDNSASLASSSVSPTTVAAGAEGRAHPIQRTLNSHLMQSHHFAVGPSAGSGVGFRGSKPRHGSAPLGVDCSSHMYHVSIACNSSTTDDSTSRGWASESSTLISLKHNDYLLCSVPTNQAAQMT